MIGKFESLHCFKNVKRLPTKYEDNTHFWMITKLFEDYLIQLGAQLCVKNHKILLFTDQVVALLKKTAFSATSKSYFSQQTITAVRINPCIQVPLQKAFDSEHIQEATLRCYTVEAGYLVCSALHSTNLVILTHTIMKNCVVKCSLSNDHVSNNDDIAAKLREDEEDDWQSLQPLGVQSEVYPTCDNVLVICVD